MNFDKKMAEEYYYENYPVTLNIGEEARKMAIINVFLAALKKGSQLDKVWHDYDIDEDSHEGKWVNRNSELEKKYDTCLRENATLKMHNTFIEKNLLEAKVIIKDLIDNLGAVDCEPKQILKIFKEATQFLQKDDTDHFSQLCKIVRR